MQRRCSIARGGLPWFLLQPGFSATVTASASGLEGQEMKLQSSVAMGQEKLKGVRMLSSNGANFATVTVTQLVCGAQPQSLLPSSGQSPQQLSVLSLSEPAWLSPLPQLFPSP